MLTIEQYLNMHDWHFSLQMTEGSHGEYFWLRSEQLCVVDFRDAIETPKVPFRIVVTEVPEWIDGHYEHEGWQVSGNLFLSPTSDSMQNLYLEEDCKQMILDSRLTSDEIFEILKNFQGVEYPEALEIPEVRSFWSVIEALKPFCYVSYGNCIVFIAHGRKLYEHFLTSKDVIEIEDYYRQNELNHRTRLWSQLGPEAGPDTCIEPGCERLRIQLAIRCYIHQISWKFQR